MEKRLKEIGGRVRQARKAKGLSQTDLAELIGTSPNYVSNIETGKHIMKITLLMKITDALEISNDWLLRNDTREASEYTAEEFDELFSDCTPAERAHLMKILTHVKETLRDVKESENN